MRIAPQFNAMSAIHSDTAWGSTTRCVVREVDTDPNQHLVMEFLRNNLEGQSLEGKYSLMSKNP